MRQVHIGDCQVSTRLAQLRQSKEQGAEASGIQLAQITEVQYHANLSGLDQPVQLTSKIQVLLPERETSYEIQNLDSFLLSMDDLKRHAGAIYRFQMTDQVASFSVSYRVVICSCRDQTAYYSTFSASTGETEAARLAGMRAAKKALMASAPAATESATGGGDVPLLRGDDPPHVLELDEQVHGIGRGGDEIEFPIKLARFFVPGMYRKGTHAGNIGSLHRARLG